MNTAYYRYEANLFRIICEANPVDVRGALAGVIRYSDNADLTRRLHAELRQNSMPGSDLEKELNNLKECE